MRLAATLTPLSFPLQGLVYLPPGASRIRPWKRVDTDKNGATCSNLIGYPSRLNRCVVNVESCFIQAKRTRSWDRGPWFRGITAYGRECWFSGTRPCTQKYEWIKSRGRFYPPYQHEAKNPSRSSSPTRGASDVRLRAWLLWLSNPSPPLFPSVCGSMPGSPSRQGASTTSSPTDNPPSSSRLSKDSDGYPSWLPKRPPPPAPTSTFQSSILGGGLDGSTPSPVEPTPFVGGRKPTPRSVRIVNLQDSFVGAVEKDGSFRREPTDQTQVGVNVPPKVWTRASGVPPTAFSASEHDDMLPLPQPRFNAKSLHLQILEHPSKWMRVYYFLWPLIVFYHIPLQTFFDFNAVFVLLQ